MCLKICLVKKEVQQVSKDELVASHSTYANIVPEIDARIKQIRTLLRNRLTSPFVHRSDFHKSIQHVIHLESAEIARDLFFESKKHVLFEELK